MKGLVLFLLLAHTLATTRYINFFDANDVIYLSVYEDANGGCIPEPKNNGRETICTNTAFVPPDINSMNTGRIYYGNTRCVTGDFKNARYRDSYCGFNPLEGTYFFNRCYSPGFWLLETYSDANCTQLIQRYSTPIAGTCKSNFTENSSSSFSCGSNSWKPTTASTTTTRSLLLVTRPPDPNTGALISAHALIVLVFIILLNN